MFQGPFFPEHVQRRRKTQCAFALALITATGHGEQSVTSVELKPKQIKILPISLEKDQVAQVHLHVEDGLLAVRANLPGTKDRPVLKIDMGRGAQLT